VSRSFRFFVSLVASEAAEGLLLTLASICSHRNRVKLYSVPPQMSSTQPPEKLPRLSSSPPPLAFARTSSGAAAVHPRVHATSFSSLKHKSHMLVGHPERDTWAQMSCARANLRACGDWSDEDWGKPHITIAAP
jgi:hypothetical protein